MGKRVSNKRGKHGARRFKYLHVSALRKKHLDNLQALKKKVMEAHEEGKLPGIDYEREMSSFKRHIRSWLPKNILRRLQSKRGT